jgi:transcription antitermination factor NusG
VATSKWVPNRNHDRGTDTAGACPPAILPGPGTLHQWYALRLKSNREFQVRSALYCAGFEVFLPTWSEQTRWSDRNKTVVRPLFPGYIFARLWPAGMVPACMTRGVVQILPNSYNPVPVTAAEIDTVRRLQDSPLRPTPCDYVAGELVTIDSGPLAGVSGVIQKIKGAQRLVVRIELLRRAVSVEIDAETVVRKA